MADTGYNWGAWGFMQKSGGDWEDDSIASGAYETGDEVSCDGLAAIEIGVEATAGGVPTAPMKVFILRTVDGTLFEDLADASTAFSFDLENGIAHMKAFPIDPGEFGSFKVSCGGADQAMTTSVTIRTATIPVAS